MLFAFIMFNMNNSNAYNKTHFLVGIPETVGDEDDARVDEESDEHAGSNDLGIRILILVQVPSSTHA